MPGTLSSGRPGGNPELEKYQFKAKGEEPLNEKITIRVTASVKEFLESLGKDYREFVREAIAEKIERHAAAPGATRTETTELATAGQQLPHNQTSQEDREEGISPTPVELEATPGKRRKAGQTQERKPVKPKNQSQNRKSTATEN